MNGLRSFWQKFVREAEPLLRHAAITVLIYLLLALAGLLSFGIHFIFDFLPRLLGYPLPDQIRGVLHQSLYQFEVCDLWLMRAVLWLFAFSTFLRVAIILFME